MKVKWRQEAIQSRRQIARYISKNFGQIASANFMEEVHNTEDLLKRNPNIAHIDPLFDDRVNTYRSIFINRRSKLVYRIDGDEINIVAFWDCRRDPDAAAKEVK